MVKNEIVLHGPYSNARHPPILSHWWISRQKVRKCDSRQWIKRAYSKILAKDCSKSWQKIVQIHRKNLGMGQTSPLCWFVLVHKMPKLFGHFIIDPLENVVLKIHHVCMFLCCHFCHHYQNCIIRDAVRYQHGF